jgi:hypothetical protein
MIASHGFVLSFCCLLPAGVIAQDEKPAKDDRGAQILKVALHNLRKAPGVMVTAIEDKPQPFAGGGKMLKTRCEAFYAGGDLLSAIIDDDIELVSYRGRTAVRSNDSAWVLRRDRLAHGENMPFVADLHALLHCLETNLEHATLGQPDTVAGVQVQQVELVLEGNAATEALWSGALPEASSGFGNAMVFVGGMGGGRMRPATPDLAYRLMIAIDPGTRQIVQIAATISAKGDGNQVWRAVGGAPQIGVALAEENDDKKAKDEADAKADNKADNKAEKNAAAAEEAAEQARAKAAGGFRIQGGQAQVVINAFGVAGGDAKSTQFTLTFRTAEPQPAAIDVKVRKLLGMPDVDK